MVLQWLGFDYLLNNWKDFQGLVQNYSIASTGVNFNTTFIVTFTPAPSVDVNIPGPPQYICSELAGMFNNVWRPVVL